MTDQPDLLTYAEAEARRDDGMTRAAESSGEGWHRYAVAFIEEYARGHDRVFVDDLWESGLERPAQPKALGPAMLAASRAGIIAKTGEYRPSVSSNLLPKPVWRSLVYDGRPIDDGTFLGLPITKGPNL